MKDIADADVDGRPVKYFASTAGFSFASITTTRIIIIIVVVSGIQNLEIGSNGASGCTNIAGRFRQSRAQQCMNWSSITARLANIGPTTHILLGMHVNSLCKILVAVPVRLALRLVHDQIDSLVVWSLLLIIFPCIVISKHSIESNLQFGIFTRVIRVKCGIEVSFCS
jgi:hypothetical protein